MNPLEYKREDRARLTAVYLGLDPFRPETWPAEEIEKLLKRVERAAEIAFADEIHELSIALAAKRLRG